MILRRLPTRRGTTVVECAMVYPVTFLLLFGLIIGGLGVFRYQQVASLAREGARYASVHGAKYAQSTGRPAATPLTVYQQAILPRAVAFDPSRLTYNVTWSPDNRQGSDVTVQVTYAWVPEGYLGGITLSSTSTMRMSY
jgi:Flp pilus assembly protein TadG